jgi:hypothetical protein
MVQERQQGNQGGAREEDERSKKQDEREARPTEAPPTTGAPPSQGDPASVGPKSND